MTPEELNTLAELVTEKIWDKLAVVGAASIFRSTAANPSPVAAPTPDDYISTDQITHEFGCSKQWLYNQRKRHPQCSRLVKTILTTNAENASGAVLTSKNNP